MIKDLYGTLWGLGPIPHSLSVGRGHFLREYVPLFAALNHPNKDSLKLKLLKLKPNQGMNFDLWSLLC